ncbi:MAG: CDP-diacylglycerol--serine O-phosphatidyltransferase [Bacteroidaceae bacterium]|nr:CDP-diacylglycerol--serine O-phosphatidyltransferase [Bacteroidaceae bacterium]
MLAFLPNTLTCCNLICGCMAAGAGFHGHYVWALIMILAGAVFDFFDGMVARLLGVSSPIGKELDSLADVVTFGVAPSAMLFQLYGSVQYPDWLVPFQSFLPYTAFLVAAFSGLRLAKFNIDQRQTSSFIGLPTPANALFWASLIVSQRDFLCSQMFNAVFLFLLMFFFCLMLVAELPLFALKFKNLSWRDNKVKYIFVIGCLLLSPLCVSAIPAIIVWYILLSIINNKVLQRA